VWLVTDVEVLEFGLGGVLVVGDVVDLVQLEQVAYLLGDDDVQNVDILLVDGQDAVVQLVPLRVVHQAVESVGQAAQGVVVPVVHQLLPALHFLLI
jgi:hypothetical protein